MSSLSAKSSFAKQAVKPSASDNEWIVNYADSVVCGSEAWREPTAQPQYTTPLLVRVCRVCASLSDAKDGRRTLCSTECAKQSKRTHLRNRQAVYRSANELRERCRQALKNAINAGYIRRPKSCEGCREAGFVEAHHEDYSRPFYVEWLCRACHAGLEGGRHFGAGERKSDSHNESLRAVGGRR